MIPNSTQIKILTDDVFREEWFKENLGVIMVRDKLMTMEDLE